MKTQRCVWGSHAAINSAQAKPFLAWFNRAENGGFLAYDSLAITQQLSLVTATALVFYAVLSDVLSTPTLLTVNGACPRALPSACSLLVS